VQCGRCALVFEAPVPGKGPKPSNPNLKPVRKPDPEAAAARAENVEKLARILKPRRPGDPAGGLENPALSVAPLVAGPQPGGREPEKARLQPRRPKGFAMVAGVVAAIAGLAVAAPSLRKRLSGGLSEDVRAKVEAARRKLLLDDAQSLAQAIQLYREAARLAPGEAQVEADVAYATLLLSEVHRDQAERLDALARDKTEQVTRLQAAMPDGWEAKTAALVDEVGHIADRRRPHASQSEKLLGEARSAARAAAAEDADDPAVLRALALYFAVTDPEKGREFLEKAQARSRDALTTYVRAAATLAGGRTRDKQDRALAALAEVQQAEPAMLRAQYDGAAIAFERHQYGPAREALERVLKANPNHERAKLLLAALPASTLND
jgi:tetratricopeptide (TPR) repeat protein